VSYASGQRKRKIIIPGQEREGMRTLHVPRGYETGPTKIVGVCHTCGERFDTAGSEQAWQEHVGKCARRHLGEIMTARAAKKKRMAVFDTDTWDPEYEAHMRRVGERMIREGRLVTRPNER
jgi:hypothetical protein